MTRIRLLVPTMFIAFIILAASIAGIIHADTKHIEAPVVRATIKRGLCHHQEIWYSPPSGRILFLCQLEIEEKTAWAGWVVFITANRGKDFIAPHEATTFVASEWYWRDKIARDGYEFGLAYPHIVDYAISVLGISTH